MSRLLEQGPTSKKFNWPVIYIKEHGDGTPSESVKLKVRFSSGNIDLVDINGSCYHLKLVEGYTVLGSSRYGGYNVACTSYKAVGSLDEIDLFMVIPSSGAEFTNRRKIKIIFPSPTKLGNVTITPEPLAIFQQFSFNLLSKRIHDNYKPSL